METEQQARGWAMVCHLSGFAKYTAIPFANIIAPLVLWQLKKDAHPLIDDQGKEALNFQISMTLYVIVGVALIFCLFIGIPVLAALAVVDVVLMVVAGLKANAGEFYRYPLTIRLIK
jgi:hypothetical protein